MENRATAELLRNIAIAYEVGGASPFRVRAYRQAADSIESHPIDIKLVWKQGNLQKLQGVGGSIAQHLDELYSKGESDYFNSVLDEMPKGMFDLMKLRGVGPKSAFVLAQTLNKFPYDQKKDIYARLDKALADKAVQELEGFGPKSQAEISGSLAYYKQGITKKKRLLIHEADAIVNMFTKFVQLDSNVNKISTLGSYRRRKDTIGDLDMGVITKSRRTTIEHIKSYEGIQEVVDVGEQGVTLLVQKGVQIDIRFSYKKSWGAMIQYFTGSKNHNIALRELAQKQKLSLNEHGVKKIHETEGSTELHDSEDSFYKRVGLPLIPPELREDRGEIQAALKGTLPNLVTEKQVKGDLHLHQHFDFPTSHDIGKSTLEELVTKAQDLGYEYIAIADHNPKKDLDTKQVINILNQRKDIISNLKSTNSVQNNVIEIKVYKMMEVDIFPDGTRALPDKAADYLDGMIISIHSSFNQDMETTTKRLLRAIDHPKVRIIGHPTGRLINKRESINADWETIFKACKVKQIALEINANPNRLDLPDVLVKQAKDIGCRFVINTDAHHKDQMNYMQYGVSVARRGWLEKNDILNTLPTKKFEEWLIR